MRKILILLLILICSVSSAKDKRHMFEVEIKNVASKVSTTMRIFAENEAEARREVELNGWQVILVKQLTFDYGEAIPIQIGTAPVKMVPVKEITDDELVDSLLGKPEAEMPIELPFVMAPLLPDSDRLEYMFTIYFDFGIIEPVVGEKERADLAKLEKNKIYYVFGHTDNVTVNKQNTTYTDNFDLSFKRAEIVKRILIGYGANAERLSTVGLGPTYPSVPNLSMQGGTPKNRRAEVYMLKQGN